MATWKKVLACSIAILILACAGLLLGIKRAYPDANFAELRGASPSWFGMVEIADDVFVDKSMGSAARGEFLASVDSAKDLVTAAFKERLSGPAIIGCSTQACFQGFGLEGMKGKTYHDWWLVMGPQGLSSTYLAHELAHAELHHRIGFYRTFFKFPHWMDEGMATWVSRDARFMDSAGVRKEFQSDVPEAGCRAEWRRLMQTDVKAAYGFACWAFDQWYQHHQDLSLLWRGKPGSD